MHMFEVAVAGAGDIILGGGVECGGAVGMFCFPPGSLEEDVDVLVSANTSCECLLRTLFGVGGGRTRITTGLGLDRPCLMMCCEIFQPRYVEHGEGMMTRSGGDCHVNHSTAPVAARMCRLERTAWTARLIETVQGSLPCLCDRHNTEVLR